MFFVLFLVLEPTSMPSGSFTVNIDLNTQSTTESLMEKPNSLTSNIKSATTKINAHQVDKMKSTGRKRRKRPRKQVQLKQRSMIGESSQIEEQIDDTSEEDDDEEENTKIY
jgi:hypothetical protein